MVSSNLYTSRGWPEGSLFDSLVGEGATPSPGLLQFTLDPYLILLSKEASSTIFWAFSMTQTGIGPRSPRPMVNTLTIMPMSS